VGPGNELQKHTVVSLGCLRYVANQKSAQFRLGSRELNNGVSEFRADRCPFVTLKRTGVEMIAL
jgi:hypothetical protein